MKTRNYIFSLLCSLVSTSAFAAHLISTRPPVQIGVAGAANYGLRPENVQPGANITGNIGYGGGVLVGVPLNPNVSIEPSALFMVTRADSSFLGQTVTVNTNVIRVPVVARFGINNVVSLGGGLYYDYFNTSGNNSWGAEGSVRLLLGGGPTKMFFDTRLNYELKTGSQNNTELFALLGVMFGAPR
jgi:hypothetical protein